MIRLIAFITLLVSSSISLHAESENRLGLRFYGSFLYTDTVPNALFFFSDIEKNDSFELRKALRNHDIDTLVLSSRGGSVWEGLSMAGIIHDKGLTTYVPKLGLEGRGDCASACSFMFFAGKTRAAEGGVGVHQFYSGSASETAEVEETQEIAQFTVSEIIGFLNEFETPPFVFERMFQQSKMYYFDNSEMKKIARTVTPLTQENRSEIEGFINEFLIELAAFEAEEASEAEQKSEPEKSPPPKQQPAKEEPDTYTQIQIVKNIQTELNRLNCNAGLADGVIGNKTKSALARYATATEKLIDEGMLQDEEFLLELRESQITCKLPSKSYAKNLVCSDPLWATRITKIKIFNVSNLNEGDLYEIEACRDNGSCRKCSHPLYKDKYRDIEEFFKKTGMKLDDWQKGPYHVFGVNRLAGVCSKQDFKWYYKNKGSPKLIFTGPEAVSGVYYKNCSLEPNTEIITVRNNTASSKILASSYTFETCARVSNKRECSTGNLKLQRLKGGEYEFEEETSSPEAFYGVVKLKGTDVEFQMVDFIEGVAVPVSGTGKLRENSGEIIFTFTDQHVMETFKKAGINLANGELVDLQIRWY